MKVWSGKIPVTIQPLFLLLVVALGWLNSFNVTGTALWIAIITLSVLAHEYGHALTAILFGQKATIELSGLGGLTTRLGPRLKLWQEFLVVLNGPLVGILLFLGSAQILRTLSMESESLASDFFTGMVYVNLFWTIVNLLPVYPLDGGHLLRIILESLFGVGGIKFSFLISMLAGVSGGIFFFSYGMLLPGVLFFMFTFESYRNWQEIRGMTTQDRDLSLQRNLRRAERLMHTGHRQEALDILLKLREEARSGLLFVIATEYAAKVLLEMGNARAAYEILLSEKTKLSPEGLHLLQRLAYENGEWKTTIEIGNESYQNVPDAETALLNAKAHASLNESEAAIGWLQTAFEKGLPNGKEVLENKAFDSVRSHPDFQQLLS